MCGRYTVLTEDEVIKIREILKDLSMKLVRDDFLDYTKQGNEVFPTNMAPLIARQDEGYSLEAAKWGFKKWDGKGVIINARSESIMTKASFAPHLFKGRCVIPAGQFFEWAKLGTKKIKHFAKDKDGNLLFMAGLYRDTDLEREFVIITKNSMGQMEAIHDRMPVILKTNQIED